MDLQLMGVVYFNQLLGAVCTRKLVELLFSAVFNLFCSLAIRLLLSNI